jgi:hypothetical protein
MALEMILPSSACTLMEKAQMIAANNAARVMLPHESAAHEQETV